MSTFMRNQTKCCKCGSECKVTILSSTNAMGSPDLDLRPPEMQRSTMHLWLQSCPDCDYVNTEIDKDNGISREFLEIQNYTNCDDIKFKNPLAYKFYKYYRITYEIKDFEAAYNALLHTAWCCDDADDIENGKKCRLMLIEIFEKFPAALKQNENIMARHADVVRRAGLFDSVIEKYSKYSVSEPIVDKVIKFQVELSKKKDASCHRVDECL